MGTVGRWVLAGALLGPVLVTQADAQVSTPDSGKSRLSFHIPLPIPFLHHRQHAGQTRSAEPDSAFLRIETGYDGNFNSSELSRDESSSVTVIIRPTSRFEVQGDFDFWASETAPHEPATRGRGDTRLTVQWTAFTIHPGRIAVALAYTAKLPTASEDSLGTGRVDHRLLAPVSFAFLGMQIDAYAGLDADRQAAGLEWGVEGAASATVDLTHKLSVYAGLSTQEIDTDLPAGRYAFAGLTWLAHPLLALDLGARVGLDSRAPAYGLIAGMTAAVVTKSKRH